MKEDRRTICRFKKIDMTRRNRLYEHFLENTKEEFEWYLNLLDYVYYVFEIGGIIKFFDKDDKFIKDITSTYQFVQEFNDEQVIGVMETGKDSWQKISSIRFGL